MTESLDEVGGATPPSSSNYIYTKDKVGSDTQDKIQYIQEYCYSIGYNQDQVHWIVAMADHESAGTWSTTIKGDNGCSTGIGQWNACAGSGRAPRSLIYKDQAEQLCDEMKPFFDQFPIEIAVGKHNAPAWDRNTYYVNRVRKSLPLYK